MEFDLPEELKMVRDLARDFVDEQLRPLEREILGRAADLSDARTFLPEEKEAGLIDVAKATGLWGIGVPEELGGAGLDVFGTCLVEEELARTIVPFRPGDVSPILFECQGEQVEKYLKPALAGQKQPLLAFAEPGQDANATAMAATVVRQNGDYVLNGEKLSFSRRKKDSFAVVFAGAEKRITCLLVDEGTPGFSLGGEGQGIGWLATVPEPLTLDFDDCHVPAENLLGKEGQALRLGEKWLPARRVVRAARCVGIAGRLLEEATLQAQSMETFGQPIHRRPGIRAALADIAVNIYAARLVVYEAAWQADRGRLARRGAAMAGLYATRMLGTVADRLAHIFNGPAYNDGLPMERLCRHVLAGTVAETAVERQRDIIAGDVLKGLRV